jgi:hypothetical protein
VILLKAVLFIISSTAAVNVFWERTAVGFVPVYISFSPQTLYIQGWQIFSKLENYQTFDFCCHCHLMLAS